MDLQTARLKLTQAEQEYAKALVEAFPIGTKAKIWWCGYQRTGEIVGHRGQKMRFSDGKKSDTWCSDAVVELI